MKNHIRIFGQHYTPKDIVAKYIVKEILPFIYRYTWVDLFAGEGNLVLPLLEHIPREERVAFFKDRIFLYDIQLDKIELCVRHALEYGIPEDISRKNIQCRDTLASYPSEILNRSAPVYHITNPPYLYLGYIKKNLENSRYTEYFQKDNEGYQDLYHIALINDLRHKVSNMIYIIPTNFLYGNAGTKKIRNDILRFYRISKSIIFERQIFENTGMHVMIVFFQRKKIALDEIQEFDAIKIRDVPFVRKYILKPEYSYKGGTEFEDFLNNYRYKHSLRVRYYINMSYIEKNTGEIPVKLLDVSNYHNKKYRVITAKVNNETYNIIQSNPLFLRTIDSGVEEGRVGLYLAPEIFQVDAVVVTGTPHRTHPVQVLIYPQLSKELIFLLRDYFNFILEHFRTITDSEFMTTYKYSNSKYVRKYLGLSQAKKIIETFPWKKINKKTNDRLKEAIDKKDVNDFLKLMEEIKKEEVGMFSM